MAKYLISFPSDAMQLSEEAFIRAGVESRAVIEQAKAAGVYVFGGGIDESIDPVLVAPDGSIASDIYPGSNLNGGFTVLEVPTRREARNGHGESPSPAAAHKNFASSFTTPPANVRSTNSRPCTR